MHSGYLKRHLAASSAVAVSPPSSMTAETFSRVAGFCYGRRVALSPSTLAAVWVAAEWLEMGDDDTGLVARAERYFHREVAASGEDPAATVLRSCAAFQLPAEAAAAAEVAASCVEVLAASGGGADGRWTEALAPLSAEQFRRLAAAIRVRQILDHDLLYRIVNHYLHVSSSSFSITTFLNQQNLTIVLHAF